MTQERNWIVYPAEPLAETLIAKGVKVGTWDPHIDFGEYPEGVEVRISDIAMMQRGTTTSPFWLPLTKPV